MARPYRVTVYESAIESLFAPGQPVYREHHRILVRMRRAARIAAPKRTRRLSGSHFIELLKVGRYNTRGRLANSAKHAAWVHEGVKGRIRPRGGRMVVPKRPGIPRWTGGKPTKAYYPAKSVRGQRANPWMSRAARQVLASYRR